MPKKGEIRLSTNLRHMREALVWLEIQDQAKPRPIRTILGDDAQQIEKSRKALQAFKFRLRKALSRKRTASKTEITLNIPREEIMEFQHYQDGYLLRTRFNFAQWANLALADDIAKSTRPRGRPKLTSVERARRLSENYHIGDRQKPRIRKADRIAKGDADWLRDLRIRGETILTDTVGRQKG